MGRHQFTQADRMRREIDELRRARDLLKFDISLRISALRAVSAQVEALNGIRDQLTAEVDKLDSMVGHQHAA